MDLALLWFGLLWALLGGKRESSPGASAPPAATPAGGPGPPAPWPQIAPTGLPPFPGSGWEYDEPPPPPVVARARQLLSPLWAQGQGASKLEQTAGRWIVYRAEITRGNKHGVVAYRERRPPALPPEATPPANIQQRMPAPGATPAPAAARSVSTPAPPVTPAPAPPVQPSLVLPTLRYGVGLKPAAPVADVRLLQTKLGIAADGRFGASTRDAVREFQRRRGLDVDGVVGPQTWTALFAVRT